MMNNAIDRSENNNMRIPNKAFDSEYATQFKKQVMFLRDKGINYVFVKKTGDYKIPTYKYTKTPELFRAVAEFYEFYRNEREFNKYANTIEFVNNDFVKEVMSSGI